jgi:hypothetical protein
MQRRRENQRRHHRPELREPPHACRLPPRRHLYRPRLLATASQHWREPQRPHQRHPRTPPGRYLGGACPAIPETHASTLAAGSATVRANGKQLARVGDPVACGSSVATGSTNVRAGG